MTGLTILTGLAGLTGNAVAGVVGNALAGAVGLAGVAFFAPGLSRSKKSTRSPRSTMSTNPSAHCPREGAIHA